MIKPKLISLYSGAGGAARGFQKAGFQIVFMNDKDPDACKTLKKNAKKLKINPDVIHEGEIQDVYEFGNADVVEGGFPCQGFSIAGPRKKAIKKKKSKNRDFRYLEINDKRNVLYNYLKRAITLSNPKCFVAENVKGFVSIGEKGTGPYFDKDGKVIKFGTIAQAIITELEEIGVGYKVECKLLNAKDYGIPQNRERIFIVGIRNDIDSNFKWPIKRKSVSMKQYGVDKIRVMNNGDVFRENNGGKEDYFSSRYMSRNRIRRWNEVSFTIPAEARYVPAQPESEMWIGKKIKLEDADWALKRKSYEKKISKKLRRLSYKQCKKIQGFDDDYYFEGDLSSKYRQIGNAVPPPLMELVAKNIKKML